MDAREGLSCPWTDTSTNSDISTSGCSSVKRVHEEVAKKDEEQKARKKQKTTAMSAETNSALMDETEVQVAVEEFNRRFGYGAKIISSTPSDMIVFVKNLAQRGLTSAHSREIMEKCTASEKWLGHIVFWKILIFFLETLSLEITTLNRLEDKKTVVLRDRKKGKPLSEYTDRHMWYIASKCQNSERMKIECSLCFLEGKGTADVLVVLRWLLHHIKIGCVGFACDLTELGMSSEVFGRQIVSFAKEWKGRLIYIDSLTLYLRLGQHIAAAEIIKQCFWISLLKVYFLSTNKNQVDTIGHMLEHFLLQCPVLRQLSVFGLIIGIIHIQKIVTMLPLLVFLEVESLRLGMLALGQEEKTVIAFPGLKVLKISTIYSHSRDIENLAYIFPNLQSIQMPGKNVTPSLIYVLSKLSHLRSLETVNGLLLIETVEYLLEKLPSLECLAVGVKELDNRLAQVLSKYVGMHTLNLRGNYTTGFLASLLRPSPLMSTLKVLCVYKYSGIYSSSLSPEDQHSKKEAMKKFGCAVQMIYS
ncbi:hypothetical protein NECID01_0056 [Nematocida sp. AWRm77]|nr:hypothetical protein NECID01_0056 [Nematocida sp. AWRm77]